MLQVLSGRLGFAQHPLQGPVSPIVVRFSTPPVRVSQRHDPLKQDRVRNERMITVAEIAPLRGQQIDYSETERLKAKFARLRAERERLYLTTAEFQEILQWKFGERMGELEDIYAVNPDEIIRAITELAFAITHPDIDYELEIRMGILCSLRGVTVPVASALLALVFPEKYAVIDFRVWRQIFDEEQWAFSISDYLRYVREIRYLAEESGWPVQEVDHAIWEYDRRMSE